VGLEDRTRKTTILAQPSSITGVLGTLPSVMSRTESRNGEYSLYFEKLCAGECRLRTRRYSDSEINWKHIIDNLWNKWDGLLCNTRWHSVQIKSNIKWGHSVNKSENRWVAAFFEKVTS
jgi:hypothetical protein